MFQFLGLLFCSVKKEEITKVDQEAQTSPWMPTPNEMDEVKNSTHDNEQDEDVAEFFAVTDDNWCCHCDLAHAQSDECPFYKPPAVMTDSVIDFSSKDSGEDRCGHKIACS